MDADTAKRFTSRLKALGLDDEAESEVYDLVRDLRRQAKPSATVGVSFEEDAMGSTVRVTHGEDPVPVEFPVPDYLRSEDADEEDYEAMTLYLSLNRIEEGDGAGRWIAVDTVKDPDSRAASPSKLLLEQNTETGEYRYRNLPEVEK